MCMQGACRSTQKGYEVRVTTYVCWSPTAFIWYRQQIKQRWKEMKSERNPRERTGMCNQLEARGQEPILRGKGSTVMMVISEAHIILDCPSSHAGGHSLNTLPDVAWRRTPRKMQIAKSGSEHTFKVRNNCLGFP